MSDSVSAVLFDVDGTLIDSNYLHSVTWWEAFTQAGHDVPMARIHRAIGMGSDQLLDALLPPGRDTGNDATLGVLHGSKQPALFDLSEEQTRRECDGDQSQT